MRQYFLRLISLPGIIVVCVLLFPSSAHAATRTWDGGGSDSKLTTAANWSSDTAPLAGDDIVFPANQTKRDLTNDYTAGTSFNSITFNGTVTTDSNYTITCENDFAVTNGITSNMTPISPSDSIVQTISGATITFGGIQSITTSSTNYLYLQLNFAVSNAVTVNAALDSFVQLEGPLLGASNISKTGAGDLILMGANNGYTGNFLVSNGLLVANATSSLGSAVGSTTISSTGGLFISSATDLTYDEPLILNGPGTGTLPTVTVGRYGMSSAPNVTITLSGAITLSADANFGGINRNTKVTGTVTGTHAINIISDASFGLNGTFEFTNVPTATTTINGTNTLVASGTTGPINVAGGTLKGIGTVGALGMTSGKVAPGLSPGTLNSGAVVFSGGTFEAELGGTTSGQFDQLNVTGTVDLGTSTTLSVVPYGAFAPALGNTFTIINNDGSDAITGTFSGFAEGATITSGGYSYRISYVGGDGNDVVLTVLGGTILPVTGPRLGALIIGLLFSGAVIYILSTRKRRLARKFISS